MKAAVSSLLSSFPSDGSSDGTHTRELLTIINEECDRLNRLVEEAGEMAKLEAGEIALNLEPVAVKDIVQDALGHCTASLIGRKVDLRLDGALPMVRADRERPKAALVKFIQN